MRTNQRNCAIISVLLGTLLLLCIIIFARDVIKGSRRSLRHVAQAIATSSNEDSGIPTEKVLKEMSIEQLQELYQKYISSQQVLCRYNERMSYSVSREGPSFSVFPTEICVAEPFRPKGHCLVYSFARRTHFESNVVRRFGCDVYSLANRKDEIQESKVHTMTENYNSLVQAMESNGHSKGTTIDILKIGNNPHSSWDILSNVLHDPSLKFVKQILISFVLDKNSTSEKFISRLKKLRELYHQGFRLTHMHLSNKAVIMEHNKKKFYQQNMVTLLNTNYA